MNFADNCQVVSINKGDDLHKTAELWAKTNGYKSVYVYDMEHRFVWNFNLRKENFKSFVS